MLSLNWDVHGSLLIGTGINGVVYRVKDGSAVLIFDAPESSISSVVSDGDGNVYAGTSPKGIVYKITPDGRARQVYTKAARVLSMTADQRNNIYAVSDGTLRIARMRPLSSSIRGRKRCSILARLQRLYGRALCRTGNIGSVYMSKCVAI